VRELDVTRLEAPPLEIANTTKPGSKPATNQVFLPSTSFVRVAMLNGVDAPTGGQTDPAPVVFHVLDPANLASLFRLDITDCRFLGAATGDLPSERTKVRLVNMTCILGNGDVTEMAVQGYAIGEDGKAGIRGRLVTKQGQILANALLAGIATGMGQAFQVSASTVNTTALGTTSTLDPDQIGRAGLGGGMSQAGNALANYYMRQADKLYPVIETDGGRVVELVITKGAVYNGPLNLDGEEFRALLKRNNMERNLNDD
jgi:conjugal transfer pilus assembly protein TraB